MDLLSHNTEEISAQTLGLEKQKWEQMNDSGRHLNCMQILGENTTQGKPRKGGKRLREANPLQTH